MPHIKAPLGKGELAAKQPEGIVIGQKYNKDFIANAKS